MTSNESSKSKSSSLDSSLALETRLRQRAEDLDAAVRDTKWVSPASGLDRESDSADWLKEEAFGQRHVDNWGENFELMAAPKRRKSMFASMLRYFGVAIICGGLSGGAVLYVILQYYDAHQPELNTPPPYTSARATVPPNDKDADRSRDQPALSGAPVALSRPASQSEAVLRQPDASVRAAVPASDKDVDRSGDQPASSGAPVALVKPASPSEAVLRQPAANRGASEAGGSAGSLPADEDAKPKESNVAARTDPIAPLAGAAPLPAPVFTRKEDQEAKPAESSKPDTSAAKRDAQLAKLPADQEEKMLKRASTLMGENDIAGARLIFQYLVNHGSAAGAFALAESYDPKKLAGHRVTGLTPDANLARSWYARAAELGSKEAAAVLRKERP